MSDAYIRLREALSNIGWRSPVIDDVVAALADAGLILMAEEDVPDWMVPVDGALCSRAGGCYRWPLYADKSLPAPIVSDIR